MEFVVDVLREKDGQSRVLYIMLIRRNLSFSKLLSYKMVSHENNAFHSPYRTL